MPPPAAAHKYTKNRNRRRRRVTAIYQTPQPSPVPITIVCLWLPTEKQHRKEQHCPFSPVRPLIYYGSYLAHRYSSSSPGESIMHISGATASLNMRICKLKSTHICATRCIRWVRRSALSLSLPLSRHNNCPVSQCSCKI